MSAIQKEGLKMCIDMKISNQASKEKRKAKYVTSTNNMVYLW